MSYTYPKAERKRLIAEQEARLLKIAKEECKLLGHAMVRIREHVNITTPAWAPGPHTMGDDQFADEFECSNCGYTRYSKVDLSNGSYFPPKDEVLIPYA